MRRLRGGAWFARQLPGVALCMSGCAQILGADDYAERSPGSDSAPGDAAPGEREPAGDAATLVEPTALFDPQSYLGGPDCAACLETHCAAEAAACEADDTCRAVGRSVRELDLATRPVFLARDVVRGFIAALLPALAGGEPPPIVANNECIGKYCGVACGRNASCYGKFAWPETFPQQTNVTLHFGDWFDPAARVDGWQVRACAPGSPNCDPWLGQSFTSAGFATLPIDLAKVAVPQSEFTGYLQVDAGPAYHPMTLHKSGPFLDGDTFSWRPPTRAVLDSNDRDRGIDSARGRLWVQPLDCAYRQMKGVTVELWSVTRDGFQPCEECKIWYADNDNLIDLSLTDLSSRGELAYPVNVPSGEYMVVVRDTQSRIAISVFRSLLVRPDYIHILHMFPASAYELAHFPKEAIKGF